MLSWVARAQTAEDFGRVSMTYALLIVCVTLVQALVGETLLVSLPALQPSNRESSVRAASGLALSIATSLAVVGAAILMDMGGQWQPSVALAVSLPAVVLCDTARLSALSDGRARLAFLGDTVWLVLQFVLGYVLVRLGTSTASAGLWGWGLAAYGGAIVFMMVLRLKPEFRKAPGWFAANRNMSLGNLLESIAMSASSQLTTVLVGMVSGPASAGGLRAAQTVFGPSSVLIQALRVVGISETRRRTLRKGSLALMSVAVVAGAGCAVTLAYFGILVLLPHSAGKAVFGATWTYAAPLLIAFGAQKVFVGLATGSSVGLRAAHEVRLSLVSRLALAVLTLVGGVAGAALAGAPGCAWGLALGTGAGTLVSVVAVAFVARRPGPVATKQATGVTAGAGVSTPLEI
jgi:O-antigen/teichoic acid export membrane protein